MSKIKTFLLPGVFSILILSLLLNSISSLAQEKYSIFGKVKIENGSLENTMITIYKNAEKKDSKIVDNSGKFNFDLEFGNDYMLVFSKEGFVTKKVSISTFVPNEILNRDSQFPPFKFMVSLFPAYEGLDLSIFDQPMGMIMYDKELDDFDYDRDYDSQIRDAIRKAEEEARRKAAELEAKRLAQEKAFKVAIQQGDNNFRAKKYEDSKIAYNNALTIKPKEEYPKIQIQKIDALLATQQAEAEKAAQLAAAEKALAEKYAAIIKLADSQFSSGDYITAKTSYTDALNLKAGEIYPKSQIQKIDALLATQQAESEKAAQLAAAEKALAEKYAAIIKLADSQYSSGDYISAKTSYTDALNLKAAETYPKSQIQKIDALLATQQAEAEKAAQLAAAEKALAEKYAAIIKLADSQFSSGDYVIAKTSYTDALNLKAGETYPKTQIQKIDAILATQQAETAKEEQLFREKQLLENKYLQLISSADKFFNKEIWESAIEDYKKALNFKSEEAYPKNQIKEIESILHNLKKQEADKLAAINQYKDIIQEADLLFKQEEYQSAITKYEMALGLKPKESYPKNQIKRIEVELENLRRKDLKKQELEQKYENEIAKADVFFKNEDYSVARHHYQSALDIKSEQAYPKEKLLEIEDRLNALKMKQDLALEEKRNNNFEKNLMIGKEKDYSDIIEKADQSLKDKKYKVAGVLYERALQLFDRDYPTQKIAEINNIIKDQRRSKQSQAYKALIARADEELNKQHYSVAKFYYNKARSMDSSDNYTSDQLKKIRQLMDSKKDKRLENEYQTSITKADDALNKGNLTVARFYYEKAGNLKPDEKYPKQKLKAIKSEQSKK